MGYLSTGMADRFGALLVSLMALWLALVDQNPFLPCYIWQSVKQPWNQRRSPDLVLVFTSLTLHFLYKYNQFPNVKK